MNPWQNLQNFGRPNAEEIQMDPKDINDVVQGWYDQDAKGPLNLDTFQGPSAAELDAARARESTLSQKYGIPYDQLESQYFRPFYNKRRLEDQKALSNMLNMGHTPSTNPPPMDMKGALHFDGQWVKQPDGTLKLIKNNQWRER